MVRVQRVVSMSAARRRSTTIAAVIALHFVFVIVIERLRQQERDVVVDISLTLVNLEQRARREPQPQREPDEPAPRLRNMPPQAASASSSSDESMPQAETSPRVIDWRANALRSAEVVAAGSVKERYRSFGPKRTKAVDEPAVPSVFGDGPKHELGDIGGDPREPIVWLGDRCFLELEKPVQTARDWVVAGSGFFAMPIMRCMNSLGRSEPNGKLFEHIKKREEPPVPKAGTEMNPLPERIAD